MSNKGFIFIFCSLCILSTGIAFAENDASEQLEKQSVTTLTIAEKDSGHFSPFTGKVTGNRVRLRTIPSLEAHVVREMNEGELFSVVAEKEDFYAVLPSEGTKGYVFRTFVLENTIEADRVNVRLYPDIDAPVVGQLNSGDHVNAIVSCVNNKWLEIDLSDTTHFYISKEYLENIGPVEMIAQKQARKQEAWHLLSSAFHFAQSEILKPFDEIDLEKVDEGFNHLVKEFPEFPEIVEKAQEITGIIHEAYIQKKIYFLEFKADRTTSASHNDMKNKIAKLSEIGQELQLATGAPEENLMEEAETNLDTPNEIIAGKCCENEGKELQVVKNILTDKMFVWLPFEESLYHMWAASGGPGNLEAFYREETKDATQLVGIIEQYNRPVKNRPGDYLLRFESLPIAFLYSTKVNLQENIGKKVVITVSPRPNNNFAFPAYFVHSVE